MRKIELTMVVFPTPGPPVMTSTLEKSANCSSPDRTCEQDIARGTASQAPFPDDARRTAEREAVEFGVEIGEYRGVVRSRGAFPAPAPGAAHPRAVRRSLLSTADAV